MIRNCIKYLVGMSAVKNKMGLAVRENTIIANLDNAPSHLPNRGVFANSLTTSNLVALARTLEVIQQICMAHFYVRAIAITQWMAFSAYMLMVASNKQMYDIHIYIYIHIYISCVLCTCVCIHIYIYISC